MTSSDDSERQMLVHNLDESYGPESFQAAANKCALQQILYTIGLPEAAENIEDVTRIGGNSNHNGSSRPLLVKFTSNKYQIEALAQEFQLQNIPKWKDIIFEKLVPQQLSYDPEKEAMRKRLEELEKQLAMIMKSQNNSIAASSNVQTTSDDNFVSISQIHHQNNEAIKLKEEPMTIETNSPLPLTSNSLYSSVAPAFNQFSNMEAMYNYFLQYQQATTSHVFVPNTVPEVLEPFRGQSPSLASKKDVLIHPELPKMNLLPSNLSVVHPTTSEVASESPKNLPMESDILEEPEYANDLFKSQTEESLNGPKTILNILVLGETGVGKSTWINGIANYLSFNKLGDALGASEPICLIPSKFTFYETSETKTIVKLEASHGEKDENEAYSDQGQSSTQEPKTFQFETPKYIINIIDTPGVGDTRGPEQDKENTRKILAAISQYQDLHAICFLFKANEARMSQSFRYCISELLLQLHKDAAENIIFFFTNARGTFYKPGDTMVPLTEFLTQLHQQRGLKIPLEPEKICCIDNEAFRLVCAAFKGAKVTDEDFENFAGSWQHSASETHRFIEIAAKKKPHRVADTISVNKARTVILHLAKPLADVNELIISNIKVFEDRKDDLINTSTSMEALKKKLKISQIGIEVKPLDYPKTVCTAQKCIETARLPNTEQFQTIYKQICHDHCYLTGVDVERVPEPHLQGCTAMGGQECCQVCECPWSTHMHIRFDQIKTTLEIEDKNTKELIEKNKSASTIKKQMLKDCELKVKDLKAEQSKIIKASLRFGSFLQANAILPYNDAFEKYVEQTISEEEKCIQVGGDQTKLKNLKKLLAEYQQEKALIAKAAKKSKIEDGQAITPAEIEALKTELFSLPHTGKTLKALFTASEDGIAKHNAQTTVKYKPSTPKLLSKRFLGQLTKNLF